MTNSSQDVAETTINYSKDKRRACAIKDNPFIYYSLFWSILLIIASPISAIIFGEGHQMLEHLRLILISPSKLVTDYFMIGGIGASFLNAGLCGLSCNILMFIARPKNAPTILAGYFLVIAHCFYGLNLFNMWPPILGIFIYCVVKKEKFGDIIHLAMFSTSLGPFISDLLFRYTLGDKYVFGEVQITSLAIILTLLFGLVSGFLIPALLPGTTKMHRGFNLYKAGLAIGLFGMFANALLYKTMGIDAPDVILRDNELYSSHGVNYIYFIDAFFIFVFLTSIAIGFVKNKCSFRGYKKIWNSDGLQDDFQKEYGMPLTMINIGIYGLFILLYMNLVLILTQGVGYTGPTVGVTIAAITFSAAGQTPKNVYPIAIGYLLLSLFTQGICGVFGLSVAWTLSTQGYINGFAFATGLCPFTGKYGRRYGIIAGMLHAILCTSTAAMHGGFVLYNGGLTSGLTALLLIPILDFYKIKTKEEKALKNN